jgi:hypothetical protein
MSNLPRLLATAVCVSLLVSCGGGGTSTANDVNNNAYTATPADIAYLSNYQGIWYMQCTTPLKFNDGSFGPASVRTKLEFSSPSSLGVLQVRIVDEYFANTLNCYDKTSTPMVSITALQLPEFKYSGKDNLGLYFQNADIFEVTQLATSSVVTGASVTQVLSAGVEYWRIQFPDGKSFDVEKNEKNDKFSAGIQPVNVNGTPFAQLNLYSDNPGRDQFIK